MNTFERTNLEHIREIFEKQTGVELPARKKRLAWRGGLVLAAVLGCLTVGTAANQGMFSVLDGDDLSLGAVYQGGGVVAVEVENHSDRDLRFQPQLKLSRWTSGEEMEQTGRVIFEHTAIPAGATGTMTIDLSEAYDVAELERPLKDDWYYLTLTNNNFIFGQDWFCSVDFAENTYMQLEYPEIPGVDADSLATIEESLRPYFQRSSVDIQDRRIGEASYIQAYTRLLEDFRGNVVPSVSPVLPGFKFDTEMPYLTVSDAEDGIVFDPSLPNEEQSRLVGLNWYGRDAGFKLISREGEHALTISALMPDSGDPSCGHYVPLFYLLTYKTDEVRTERYAFIYGKLVSFEEMEKYQVFCDEDYICYEVSPLMYADPLGYAMELAENTPDLMLNEGSIARLSTIYDYYRENLNKLMTYR